MQGYFPTCDDSLGYLACKLSRLMTGYLAKTFLEAGLDITVEQWRLLINLVYSDGLTQNELTERLIQDKTGVSRLVRALEKRGMVRRMPVKHDRRSRMVYLRDPGRVVAMQGLDVARTNLETIQAGIDPERLAMCKEVMCQLIINLQS